MTPPSKKRTWQVYSCTPAQLHTYIHQYILLHQCLHDTDKPQLRFHVYTATAHWVWAVLSALVTGYKVCLNGQHH